jgi:hypothetical protein
MLQYGVKDLVFNSKPRWAEQVELNQVHGIGGKPQFMLLNSCKF